MSLWDLMTDVDSYSLTNSTAWSLEVSVGNMNHLHIIKVAFLFFLLPFNIYQTKNKIDLFF